MYEVVHKCSIHFIVQIFENYWAQITGFYKLYCFDNLRQFQTQRQCFCSQHLMMNYIVCKWQLGVQFLSACQSHFCITAEEHHRHKPHTVFFHSVWYCFEKTV